MIVEHKYDPRLHISAMIAARIAALGATYPEAGTYSKFRYQKLSVKPYSWRYVAQPIGAWELDTRHKHRRQHLFFS
jgi:hypothetical protein